MSDETSNRILILASSIRDSQVTSGLLAKYEIENVICENVDRLIDQMNLGVGALVVAKEALNPDSLIKLADVLNRQPKWSFIPVILLIAAGDLTQASERTLKFLSPLRNATFLERPIRQSTLLSIVRSALADRQRQFEVRDLLMALDDSRKEAVRANQSKSEFLANMSHEIRTPLGAIIGFSELLMEPSVSKSEKQTFMETIKRNGQMLSALVNDILDLAKVEAGQLKIEKIKVSLNELITDVVASFELRATQKGIRLLVQKAKNVPEFITTDPIRLKQILVNLIGNSIKFTDSGFVKIEMRTNFKKSDSAHREAVLCIQVVDTGIGISKAHAERLFRPFSQADGSITRRFGGTGLGLVLSRKLSESMDGRLDLVQSKVGKGSAFELQIPLVESDLALIPLPDLIVRSSMLQPLSGTKVLIVDDSSDNQLLMGHILELAGAEVDVAKDGLEGVTKCLQGQFDVVLMDLQMPNLGGVDAFVRLRSKGFQAPIVAVTAHAFNEVREHCQQIGFNGFLTKPVQRNEIVSTIAKFKQSNKESTKLFEV